MSRHRVLGRATWGRLKCVAGVSQAAHADVTVKNERYMVILGAKASQPETSGSELGNSKETLLKSVYFQRESVSKIVLNTTIAGNPSSTFIAPRTSRLSQDQEGKQRLQIIDDGRCGSRGSQHAKQLKAGMGLC
ncbi:uncharacterized protein EV420DRAFT_1485619 [Desarmillaria tabescens]|uniref:Uncharacterized protein n=1 Tax=Armillaria tabescens TaxID=1929756 RepID=A0AA39MPQ2_ARMTA|nr:uncharacterized protein EV420DRAFT_1485619 [Desarmillaria tabescens]KAK0441454.1 hypothetical protein EV420DRAFT_1485619 [Desarmillaria tabescens]